MRYLEGGREGGREGGSTMRAQDRADGPHMYGLQQPHTLNAQA